jgi:amino acid transporter
MFVVMMIAFWGSTGMAFFGSKVTSKFNNFGVVLGSLLPCALLVILGIVFLASGDHSEIGAFELKKIVPEIKASNIAFMSSVILIFAGMEMSGFHALEVKNPKKDYPKAMFTAAAIIILITILGTLALAWVIPKDSDSLSAGLMQAFSIFFKTFHISWLVRPMAILITLGGLALMMNYLVGPILGMRATASDGNMPKVVAKQNKRGVPTPMLITQGLITTAVSLLFVFMKSVNEAYWILSAMTTAVLCVMYLFIFASVIILRFKAPDVDRAFKIPGGKPGVFIIAGLGFLATAFTFIVCFLPTSLSSNSISFGKYIIIFVIGVAILTLPPVVYLKLRKKQ